MSPDGGRPVRAYRPSSYGTAERNSEEAEMMRLANLELYTQRVSAGKPIFEEVVEEHR